MSSLAMSLKGRINNYAKNNHIAAQVVLFSVPATFSTLNSLRLTCIRPKSAISMHIP